MTIDKLTVTVEMRSIHFECTGMYATDAEILTWWKANHSLIKGN